MKAEEFRKILNNMQERKINDIGFACSLFEMVGREDESCGDGQHTAVISPCIKHNASLSKAKAGDYFLAALNDGRIVRFDCVHVSKKYVRFDSHDCVLESAWNRKDTNAGGYAESLIRQNVDRFYEEMMPDWLKAMIVETERKAAGSEPFTAKLFLPDESELFGGDGLYGGRLYDQLEYYEDRRNRMKGKDFEEDTGWYWTSSAGSGSSTSVVSVNDNGKSDRIGASNVNHVPVCFQISRT